MPADAVLRYDRSGSGRRMLLMHGIGHRRQMWRPVTDLLATRYDMVAIDLPGFGESPALPPDDVPNVARLADIVETTLDSLEWPAAHLVGNSLGGWLSLELARRGRALSVCGLMPAGLWHPAKGTGSLRTRAWFALWTTAARLPYADRLSRNAVLRTTIEFGLFGRPWRIPADVAAGDTRNMRTSDLPRVMAAAHGLRFSGGRDLAVPITVVFGSRDPIIRPRLTDLSELPASVTTINLRGVGHVPTWDAPELIAATIDRASTGPRMVG